MISKERNDDSSSNIRKLSSSNGSSNAGSWRSQDSASSKSKEFSRPPVYNAEDYAASLKKWTGKASTAKNVDQDITAQFPSNEGEMSLRQFLSVSDLLEKLKTDLRLAYLSFVQEFVSDPIDGTTLILELLRSIQQNDTQQQVKVTPAMHRRALLDENSCLQCLLHCLRCEEATRRLAMSSAGLFTLAVCIMSSVSKSRIISLELLSEICRNSTVSGHNAVSEALSTMRLRFGEPVRFRFLVSMLNGASSDLLIAGLQFINTFLETSSNKQTRLYIQAELEQAGLNLETSKRILSTKDHFDQTVFEEYNRWSNLYIDVETMNTNYENKCKEVSALRDQIAQMEMKIRILQDEKETMSARVKSYKERFTDLEYRCSTASRTQSAADKPHRNASVPTACKRDCGGNSTPAEDEGISSSDQDDSEELVHSTRANFVSRDDRVAPPISWHDENSLPTSVPRFRIVRDEPSKPTHDEIMGDFRNVVDGVQQQKYRNENGRNGRTARYAGTTVTAVVGSGTVSLYPEALIMYKENDIVPTKILPEPPKKSRTLLWLNKNIERNPFFEDESGGENSHCSGCSSERCAYRGSSLSDNTASKYGRFAYDSCGEQTRTQPPYATVTPAMKTNRGAANRANLRRAT